MKQSFDNKIRISLQIFICLMVITQYVKGQTQPKYLYNNCVLAGSCEFLKCASADAQLNECFKQGILMNQCLDSYSLKPASELVSEVESKFSPLEYFVFYKLCAQNLTNKKIIYFSECNQNCTLSASVNSFKSVQANCLSKCQPMQCESASITGQEQYQKCQAALSDYQECEQQQQECQFYYKAKDIDFYQDYAPCQKKCSYLIKDYQKPLLATQCKANCPKLTISDSLTSRGLKLSLTISQILVFSTLFIILSHILA